MNLSEAEIHDLCDAVLFYACSLVSEKEFEGKTRDKVERLLRLKTKLSIPLVIAGTN